MTADRRATELAAALARHGAAVRHAPALSMVAHVDDADLLARTADLLADPPDLVVITTGIGLRGWIEAARAAGVAEALLGLLSRSHLIARGPKARGALQANGLQADWVVESETSAEIVDVLLSNGVQGRSVAVQHHGAGDDGLHRALTAGGARVRDLVVYKWGPPPDPDRVRASARWAATGEIDAAVFTSALAATAWLAAVDAEALAADLQGRLTEGEVVLACVGPVTAAPFVARGLPTLQPERYRMGALVRAVIAHFDNQTQHPIRTRGADIVCRSGGLLRDGTFVPLSPGPRAVLRALVSADGDFVTLDEVLRVLPGDSGDRHAAEVAVASLQEALAEPNIVDTAVTRGYRLNLTPIVAGGAAVM